MATMRTMLAGALLWMALLPAQAADVQLQEEMAADLTAALQRSDFDAIESRYAKAVKEQARFPSGVFVANRMLRNLLPRAGAPAPGAVVDRGRDDFWVPIEEKTLRWSAQFPDSALPAIALSEAYMSHGFAHRGNGYGGTVSPQDWQKFGQCMDKSYEALMSRKSVGERDPNWWWMLLIVAKLQSWPRERFLPVAQQAIDAFPKNYDIYFAISESMLPQWGGSVEALAEFADHAAEHTAKTDGDALYARIFWNLRSQLPDGFITLPVVRWEKIRSGYDDMVRQYPDPWNLNSFARMACLAGDKATAKRVLSRIKDAVEPTGWSSRAEFNRCNAWAAG